MFDVFFSNGNLYKFKTTTGKNLLNFDQKKKQPFLTSKSYKLRNSTVMTTIYTLELENEKYYVGRSDVPNQRILAHFEELGSKWTKIHKPLKVLTEIKGDEFDEEKYTLIAMEKYGIDNVRGGSYCKIKMSQEEKDKALQTIRSITDRCYKCGEKGHFVNDCFEQVDEDKSKHPILGTIHDQMGKNKPPLDQNNSKLHDLGKAYHLLLNSRCSKEMYHNFADKCHGNCEHCQNVRIEYKYNDGEDEVFCSCVFCYEGNDWANDMFVILKSLHD